MPTFGKELVNVQTISAYGRCTTELFPSHLDLLQSHKEQGERTERRALSRVLAFHILKPEVRHLSSLELGNLPNRVLF
jgi:hypothetical protein